MCMHTDTVILKLIIFCCFFGFGSGFLRQGFSVDLEPVLELALVDQAGFELTEIHLPLGLKRHGVKGVCHQHPAVLTGF